MQFLTLTPVVYVGSGQSTPFRPKPRVYFPSPLFSPASDRLLHPIVSGDAERLQITSSTDLAPVEVPEP